MTSADDALLQRGDDGTHHTGHTDTGGAAKGENCLERDMPIDTGFAWVICFSTCFLTFLMCMYDNTLAVVFPDLLEEYDVTVTAATLVFTIYNLCFGIGSVLSTNFAVPRTDERVVVVAATTVNAISTIIISFSPNILFFHLVHIIKGISQGSMWVPALGLVEHYFRRRRSLATSLCSVGIAFSMLVSSQLVRLLTDTYGLAGAYLVLGAIELHGTAAALLLRPLQSYRRRRVVHYSSSQNGFHSPSHETQLITQTPGMVSQQSENARGSSLAAISCPTVAHVTGRVPESGVGTGEDLHTNFSVDGELEGKTYQGNVGDIGDSCRYEEAEVEHLELSSPKSCGGHNGSDALCEDTDGVASGLVRESSGCDTEQRHGRVDAARRYTGREKGAPNECRDGSFVQRLCCCCGHSSRSNLADADSDICRDRRRHNSRKSRASRCAQGLSGVVDTGLLRNWLVLLLLLSTVHGALMQYTLAYLPLMAKSHGLDKSDGALLITVAGAVNFAGMPLQGVIVDSKIISPTQFVALAQIICRDVINNRLTRCNVIHRNRSVAANYLKIIVGTMCHVIRYLTSFPSLVLLSVSQGLLGGARISLLPVVAVQLVDVHSAGKIVGFNALVATISLATHHLLLGYLKDRTGSFNLSFHYVGFGLYFSAALFLLSPVVRRLYQQKVMAARRS